MTYSSYDNQGIVKVLSFLKSHNTEYLSGQDLSDVLRISRVAVWKHIKKIREMGYKIESKQKLGYRLESNTDKLLPWEITSGLKTKTFGKHTYYFDSVDSTQNQAMKMASKVNHGTLIIAEKQTNGKGRLGRKWISPKGGIWLSIILHPKFDISVITLFPIVSALALSNAIEKTLNIKSELKWPNDITINGKKVAGMLVDASIESNKIENMILGVGINYNVEVKQIEKILKDTPNFYGVTSLSEHNKTTKPVLLVQSFLLELEEIFNLLNKGDIKKIIRDWTKKSSTINQNIELITEDGKIKGKAIKIDDDGALVISSNKKNKRITSGDIIHIIK
ncbi:MAG: biotin--[acetyl-CoA-carboxylase] ligase [Nitrosarchaeum sp.]|jgi:BirA family biotin operon repressor/biotin-[acetyl-CoA-carboxylase] ligase|uniref:biotin--[acetyl-CoA-carboxylase] ligase n=1 Tax=Nitrosarchaeum sp. TaxID=2026886 RepID=UPI002DEFA2BA|nr:biotin--[acetyl-CoA-carboxylase] ligase [Nitrosarchaeum sp.]MEC4848524.1 biotin--[acetyl-CoA-carboxylase] ligase [Nitrosarchaeum sp.]